MLLYVYWEPENAEDVTAFQEHRRELRTFQEEVEESDIVILAMSYPELWTFWAAEVQWEGAAAHVAELRKRYALVIPSAGA